jgi:hypothetical protein
MNASDAETSQPREISSLVVAVVCALVAVEVASSVTVSHVALAMGDPVGFEAASLVQAATVRSRGVASALQSWLRADDAQDLTTHQGDAIKSINVSVAEPPQPSEAASLGVAVACAHVVAELVAIGTVSPVALAVVYPSRLEAASLAQSAAVLPFGRCVRAAVMATH